jgi:DNA-binding LytR/AlgR family response regulator
MKFKLFIDENSEESVTVVAHKKSALTDELENIVLRYSGENEIFVYSDVEMKALSFCDIECVSAFEGRCEVIDKDGKHYNVRERLYEIEQKLPNYFIRINKSAIANERAIDCFKTDFGGGVSVLFKCGYSDYVSRRCFAEIKRRIKKR